MTQRTWTIVDDAATNAYNAMDEYCADKPESLISDAKEYGFEGDDARSANEFMAQTMMEIIEGMTDAEAAETLNNFAEGFRFYQQPKARKSRRTRKN